MGVGTLRRCAIRTGWVVALVVGLLWASSSAGRVVAAAGLPAQVTAGNLQILFPGTSKSGAVGSVSGYEADTYDLESGQAGNDFYGGADLTLSTDGSGGPTLSGNLAILPQGGALSAAPGAATVPATPGEILLALDHAGNYAVVLIQNATPQTVWFSYVLQSSTTAVQPSQPGTGSEPVQSPETGTPTTSPTPPQETPATPPSATQPPTPQGGGSGPTGGTTGLYEVQGNCLAVTGSGGQPLLGIGFTVAPEFPGDALQTALANDQLVLHVTVAAPSDVTRITGQQSGDGWKTPLTLMQQSGADWTFNLQLTDHSQPYRFFLTSASLTAAGLADTSSGVTEVDWQFDTAGTAGCGAQSVQGAAGGSSGTAGTAATAASGQSASNAPAPSPSTSGPTTVKLQVGASSATVDGAAQSLDVPPQIIGGRTMVPLRFLADALGAQVAWENATSSVTYTLGSTRVVLQIGNSQAEVDGQNVPLDVPPALVGGRTLVPVRFVSQELGAAVGWDQASQTVTVTYPAPAGAGAGADAGATGAPTPPGGSGAPTAASLASQYECGSFNVSGGGAGSCGLMPWLKLNTDGSYGWGSETGTYQSSVGQVTFSGSLAAWGPGQVNGSGQIVFQFKQAGKAYVVTYDPH